MRSQVMAALLGATVVFCVGAARAVDAGQRDPLDQQAAFTRAPVDGVSLGHWTERWWRWAETQPVEPYRDPDGRFCDLGQDGPVWFLAGTDGSFTATRHCIVPENTHLLVPVINMIYLQGRNRTQPCGELQAYAALNNDQLASAVVMLDGQPLGDLRLHRVRSEGCFRMREGDEQSRLAAADGYWLMLKPLPRGPHTLVVGANYGEPHSPHGQMQQNFEYQLDVGGLQLISLR